MSKSQNPDATRRPADEQLPRTWVIPAIVAAGSLIFTVLLWQLTLYQAKQSDRIRFERLADRVQGEISERLRQHERALGGLKGLFAASRSVERGEFRAYVKSLDLPAYHGALGFGFVRHVPRENLENFLARTRADDSPDFALRLNATQADLFVIEFIEPLARNLPAQGLDIAAETLRREAAVQSVEEDQAVLTRRITLVQDEKKLPGFLLLLPIYANGAVTGTAAERWRALTGWVYSPIRVDGLMGSIDPTITRQIDFEVFEDASSRRFALLYDADAHLGALSGAKVTEAEFANREYHKQVSLTFGGRTWQLHTSSRPEFDEGTDRRLSWLVLIGGIIGSVLFTFAASTSHRARRRAMDLAETMTVELREEIAMRRKLHDSLSELSNFQEAIVQSAGYAIISTTPEGVIRIFNPAAQRMLGYTEEEIIGRQTPALFHDANEVAARAREFSTELGVAVEPGFDVFVIKSCRGLPNEHEWTYVRKDGSRLAVTLAVTAIRDDAGGFAGYLGVAIDITERKRAWAELLESRQASDAALHEVELQREALDQHAIVSISDLQGKIQYANDRLCTISGFTRKELIGRNHRIINSGFHPPAFWAKFWQTVSAGDIWQGEICNRAKDGVRYWQQTTVVPFCDTQGELDRFVAISTDITTRKLAEAELLEARKVADAANQSKSEFLAEMSHEIRTPMNAVLGFTELLAGTMLNEKQRNFIETIQLSGQNLITIINDILDYSKIEAGKLEIERLEVDAITTVEAVIKTLALQAKAKSLSLTLGRVPDIPRVITADPTRVRQVLVNLIGNALKFTKQGGVTVSVDQIGVAAGVSACRNPDAALATSPTGAEACGYLRFSVTDSGIGLSPAQQARLFTKFTQAKSSTTREFGGTGLGLAICKRLVELMGGEIGVKSAEGQGSTFWFTLPVATAVAGNAAVALPAAVAPRTPPPAPAPAPAVAPIAPPAATATGPHWRVLVADDNLINQQLACAFLAKLNCISTVANNGAEAASLVQQQPFDLVLMDYQMPEMNGLEATTVIRQWEAKQGTGKHLPIIAVTANLNPDLAAKFTACGMDGALGKPFLFRDLVQLIAKLNPAGPDIPTAPSAPVFAAAMPVCATAMDRERALTLTDNNPELLGMLAQAFLSQCDGLLASIGRAMRARDAAALKQHAHKFKGSISVFATTSAHLSVLALDKFPDPPDWAVLDRHWRDLETEMIRLRPELAALSPVPAISTP